MKRTSGLLLGSLLAAGAALAGCASHYDRYGRGDWYGPDRYFDGYDYQGRDYGYDLDPSGLPYFRGEGGAALDPWLARTPEGREIVSRGFRSADGWLSLDTAHRANVWFRRYADTNNDLALTDPEIRVALVQAALEGRDFGY